MITCVGAAHIDEVVRLDSALHPGASNPARWSHAIGGVAANACRAAAAHTNAILIAAVGEDTIGAQLSAYFESSLTSQPTGALSIIRSRASGRYCAVIDQSGELVLGLAETDIAEQLTFKTIVEVLEENKRTADLLLLDTNLSHQCLRELFTQKPAQRLAAMTVSPVKAMRLADYGNAIDLLFTNRREAAALTGLPVQSDLLSFSNALCEAEFHTHVITDSTQDILVRDAHDTHSVPVTADAVVKGVNGAGDALAGATAAGVAQGLSLFDALTTLGLSAAHQIITDASAAPTLPNSVQ